MKKEKLLSLLLVMAILMSQLIFVAQVGAEQASLDTIVSEDFQGHTVGDLPSASNSAITPSTAGGSVAIAEDSVTGSKAVKITATKESSYASGISLNFSDITWGIAEVSFDFRAENHSVWFKNMYVGDETTPAAKLMNYGSKLYDKAATGTSLITFDNSVVNVKFVIDVNNSTYDVYINNEPKVTDSAFANAVSKINTLTLSATDNVAGASDSYRGAATGDGIYWIDNISVKRHHIDVVSTVPENDVTVPVGTQNVNVNFNYPIASESVVKSNFIVKKNGQQIADTAYSVAVDGTDNKKVNIALSDALVSDDVISITVKSGIAATDNVVDTMNADYTFNFTAVPYETVADNFEKHTIGEDPSVSNSAITASTAGGSVAIAADSATDSKAVKITAAKESSYTSGISLNFGDITSGVAEVSFDFRAENHSVWFKNMYVGDGTTSAVKLMNYGSKLYDKAATGTSLITFDNSVVNVKFVIDVDNSTYDVYINNELKVTGSTFANAVSKINTLTLSATDNVTGASDSYRGAATGDGIYWIDNIEVKEFGNFYSVVSTFVAENAVIEDLDAQLQIKFSKELDDTTVTKQNVLLYENGTLVSEDDYSVIYSESNKMITVVPTNSLQYNTAYKVVINKAVESVNDEKLEKNFELNFYTLSNPNLSLTIEALSEGGNPVLNLTEVAGQTITLSVEVGSEVEDFVFIGAVKTGNNVVESVAIKESNEVSANPFEVVIEVPQDVEDDSYIAGYLWDSLTNVKPICSATTTLKKD